MNKLGASRILGVVLVVLALGLAIIPQFTDCESQGNMITLANSKEISMKCHWTARSQLALAIPIAMVGMMSAVSPRRRSDFGTGALIMALGALPILTATSFIGTCANPTMCCNVAMKPALFVLGGLIMSGGAFTLFLAWRSRRDTI